MQLQFQKRAVACLHSLRGDVQYQEQTQELRLPEQMPDIGSILSVWGQVLIRGKEWRSGSMSVNGGVMAWAMYLPEEGEEPQMVEAWIPFQMKWDLPETQYDGVIRVSPLLKSVDARVTSARKLMLRASVGVLAQALAPMEAEVFAPEQVPPELQLLERTYPMLLPKEASEKSFTMEEDLQLPSSAPPMAKLLRFSLQPELIDQKVMSGKVVFRGMGIVTILYLGDDAKLHSWNFEIPFSQYADLESDYEPEATAGIWMAVTALEMDMLPDGQLRLKAGLTGQYMICDRELVHIVEDAYCPSGKVELQTQPLWLPVILDDRKQSVRGEGAGMDTQMQPVDVVFYPDQPRLTTNEDNISAELGGYFQVLGYDPDGNPVSAISKWNTVLSESGCRECSVLMDLQPSGIAQVTPMGDMPAGDILLHTMTGTMRGIDMVTAIELQKAQPDPHRPSLILRRAGEQSLWELAKCCGSTEQAIREANHLQNDPEAGQMLLIPVL